MISLSQTENLENNELEKQFSHRKQASPPPAPVPLGLEQVDTAVSFRPPELATWHRRLIMLSLCMTLFLGALNMTITATALPTIAQHLHASSQEYAWIESSYTLATTTSTPVWAKLSDIFGRKSSIITSTVGFMGGSIICALSQTSTMLITGRVVQGLGAGGTTFGDLFALAERAKYYGYTAAVFGVSSAVGPVLGGIFSQSISWRWCFYINLPLSAISIVALFFLLKLNIQQSPILEGLRSLDWVGFVLIIGSTVAFLYGLETASGGLAAWDSAMVICLMVFGIAGIVLFMVWEARLAKRPVIPFRIFQSTTNIAAFVVSCVHSFVFIAFDYFLPLYFQNILGFKPIISGVTLFALIIPLSAMTMTSGFIVGKTGQYQLVILAGALVMTLGTGLLVSLGERTEWAKIVIFQMITGVGTGMLFQSPMIALQTHLHQRDVAPAMSAFNFLRSLATSVSIVVGTVLIQQNLDGQSLTVQADTNQGHKHDFVSGLHIMWIFYTCLTGVMFFASWYIKPAPRSRHDHHPPPQQDDSTSTLEEGRMNGNRAKLIVL